MVEEGIVFQLRLIPEAVQVAMSSFASTLAFPAPSGTRRRPPVQCWQVRQQRFVMSDKVTKGDSFVQKRRFRAQKKSVINRDSSRTTTSRTQARKTTLKLSGLLLVCACVRI